MRNENAHVKSQSLRVFVSLHPTHPHNPNSRENGKSSLSKGKGLFPQH